MAHTFDTLADAIAAGYRRPGRSGDRDVTVRPYYGYDWEDEKGHKAVSVWFRKDRNRTGASGAIRIMFPPED